MSAHDPKLYAPMPAATPLPMPIQDLSRTFKDPGCKSTPPPPLPQTSLYRWATLLPALATTLALVAILGDWFRQGGFVATELAMMVLVGFSAFWIALSVASSTIGLFFGRISAPAPQADPDHSLDIALLVPVYNEDAGAVFSRVQAMRDDLAASSSHHRLAVFLLSDTRDETIAGQEQGLFCGDPLLVQQPVPLYYRRRAFNTERKTGNIRDWIENWGGSWDAFVTLDADSLMSAGTIVQLGDELAADPSAGLIQTVPRLIGAGTLFSKVQQFANNVYGGALARGLDRWSGHDGNYWGHNAIVRTRAFAACAGLPTLSGKGALGGTIKSHDFVEAALLRRGGWSVRLMPNLAESYEETPQTIIDYVLRDRRWCQGNLQHLRLLLTPGFTMASRFHMLQGAMAYIASVVWFVLLILWALMGRGAKDNVFRYFADSNPLFPQWPEMDAVNRAVVLGFMLSLLLIPKLFGIALTVAQNPALSKMGGRKNFALSALCEILLSFTLAPILMVQHVLAVMRTLLGLDAGWTPQNRSTGQYAPFLLIRFHWLETCVGWVLIVGTSLGLVSPWLLPIAASLAFAVPISWLFSLSIKQRSNLNRVMDTEESAAPPQIIKSANQAMMMTTQSA